MTTDNILCQINGVMRDAGKLPDGKGKSLIKSDIMENPQTGTASCQPGEELLSEVPLL